MKNTFNVVAETLHKLSHTYTALYDDNFNEFFDGMNYSDLHIAYDPQTQLFGVVLAELQSLDCETDYVLNPNAPLQNFVALHTVNEAGAAHRAFAPTLFEAFNIIIEQHNANHENREAVEYYTEQQHEVMQLANAQGIFNKLEQLPDTAHVHTELTMLENGIKNSAMVIVCLNAECLTEPTSTYVRKLAANELTANAIDNYIEEAEEFDTCAEALAYICD